MYVRFLLFSLFFVFSTLLQPLSAEPLLLKTELRKAQVGDFLVVSLCRIDTLLRVYAKSDDTLLMEEVVIQEGHKPSSLSWRNWLEMGAPGHLNWSLYELNLAQGTVLSHFSFTKQNWFQVPQQYNLLAQLLNLPLQPKPERLRKKVGPKPTSGPDFRVNWNPKIVFEGKKIEGVPFSVWTTRWPLDQTELSGKTVDIYLPVDRQEYPSHFPYWVEVQGALGKGKIRVIDSGRYLSSPQPNPFTQLP